MSGTPATARTSPATASRYRRGLAAPRVRPDYPGARYPASPRRAPAWSRARVQRVLRLRSHSPTCGRGHPPARRRPPRPADGPRHPSPRASSPTSPPSDDAPAPRPRDLDPQHRPRRSGATRGPGRYESLHSRRRARGAAALTFISPEPPASSPARRRAPTAEAARACASPRPHRRLSSPAPPASARAVSRWRRAPQRVADLARAQAPPAAARSASGSVNGRSQTKPRQT